MYVPLLLRKYYLEITDTLETSFGTTQNSAVCAKFHTDMAIKGRGYPVGCEDVFRLRDKDPDDRLNRFDLTTRGGCNGWRQERLHQSYDQVAEL